MTSPTPTCASGQATTAPRRADATGALAQLALWLAVVAALGPVGAAPLDKPAPERLVDAASGISLLSLPGRDSLSLQGSSPGGTAERVQALNRLLERYFASQPRQPSFRFAFAAYPEANDRMVAWAACSPDWDVRRGKARGRPAAAWLMNAATQAELAPELRTAWQAQGYRLSLGSVERVMLCRGAEIDWSQIAPTCSAPRVEKTGRYPCGADIGFVVNQP